MSDGGKGDKRRPEDNQAFEDGYSRIFGDKKAQPGRYVWDAQAKDFVPCGEDYLPPVHDVRGDIQPYRSMITGEMIEGRKQHREHLRKHGCIEVGNDAPKQNAAPKPDNRLKEMIARQVYSKLRY